MYKKIEEGKAWIYAPKEQKISKKLPVFYNPAMRANRDISILLLTSAERKNMVIADPLAGTGVRGIRFLLELCPGSIERISLNDFSENAYKLILRNLKLNKLAKDPRVHLSRMDASAFLLSGTPFDYIDIDPFGYPGPFLPAAVQRLARNGILAVTATDTSALAGSSPKACLRKYWAEPLRDGMMHETGLRILVRFVQLIGAMNEKALVPIFCYYQRHYMRAFFLCQKGKSRIDAILAGQSIFNNSGPLWRGPLWDRELALKMERSNLIPAISNLISVIADESAISTIGFYDLPGVYKEHKLGSMKKLDTIIQRVREMGYKASRTHFNPEGLRSDIPLNELVDIMR